MSLVFGLCLAKKIYLVSDSRLTYDNGSYKDDFSKWLNLNARLSVVVANSAYQSCWLLREIRKEVKESWGFSDLEKYPRENIEKLALRFYAETGLLNHSVGMIFGGFDNSKKLTIEASRLGEIMSSPVRMAGEGISVSQSIDKQIRETLAKNLIQATAEGRRICKGDIIEIDSPKPRVLAITIKAINDGVSIDFENTECYDGLVFNPKYKTERVVLPDELIGQLEYRNKSGETKESEFYSDQGYIITYIYRLLKERNWPTVGGNIVPLVMTPYFSGFAMGDYIYVPKDGSGQLYGGIVDVNGRMHYIDENRERKPYRFVYDFIGEMKNGGDAKI